MSLRKRSNTWWIDVVTPNGQRIRQTTWTGNKALAQEYHDQLKAELWRTSMLGEKPQHRWDEAVERWLKEAGHKASIEADKMHLRWLDRYLRGKPLPSISRAMIDRIVDAKKKEGVSNATVNRVVEVLRAILRKAANDWEWLDRAPAVRMLPERTRRIRWLTRNEAQRLLDELPPHLADMAAFSLATGLRRANVTGLQWSQVDLVRRVAWVRPGSGQGEKGDLGATERGSRGVDPQAVGETRNARVLVQGPANYAGQHQGLVQSAGARGHRRFPLARPAPHLGELACAAGYAVACVAGAGRMGIRGDGAQVRASRLRASCALMRIACVPCEWWRVLPQAQIWHNRKNDGAESL